MMCTCFALTKPHAHTIMAVVWVSPDLVNLTMRQVYSERY